MTAEKKTNSSVHRKAGERDALLNSDWRYIKPCNMDDYSREDWADMNRQRATYMGEQRAKQALEMLTASRNAPTFGYLINNYEHCLQTATMLYQDGRDEDTIVTGLFHDLGFIVCPEAHGRFAADLIRHLSLKKISGCSNITRFFSGFTYTDTTNRRIPSSLMSESNGEDTRISIGLQNLSSVTISWRSIRI